jgi:hypothetical protein
MRFAKAPGRFLAILVVASMLIILGAAAPAQAAYPITHFNVNGLDDSSCQFGNTEGDITWYNRTANLSGGVYACTSPAATAVFTAYASDASDSKIETQTRTASGEWDVRGFNFTIGDSNLVGGIYRIKIQVCVGVSPDWLCGKQYNFYNPS